VAWNPDAAEFSGCADGWAIKTANWARIEMIFYRFVRRRCRSMNHSLMELMDGEWQRNLK